MAARGSSGGFPLNALVADAELDQHIPKHAKITVEQFAEKRSAFQVSGMLAVSGGSIVGSLSVGLPGSWQGRAGLWDEGPGPGRSGFGSATEDDEEGETTRLVRPYAVTGGRTQPRYQLAIEALVTATVTGQRDLSVLAPECQIILQFCEDWRSVAEVSAVLRLPLGVARILIADMATEGLVRIHQSDDPEGRPDLSLLKRVLDGLRKLQRPL